MPLRNNMIDLRRLLVEATVDRALQDIRQDSKRSLRNLVDLGLNFCSGRYETYFLEMARNMLSDEQSAYFEAVQTAMRDVDTETIKTFGINVGLEGCTRGAKRIRELEDSHGFNIPWALTICAGNQGVGLSDCLRLVEEGTGLGIHVYLLLDWGLSGESVQQLASSNPKCAFLVLTDRLCADWDEMFYLAEPENVMYLLDAEGQALSEQLKNLHAARCLYGLYHWYNEENRQDLLSDRVLDDCQDAGALFLCMIPQLHTSKEARQEMNRQILALRKSQQRPFCPLELSGDLFYIDTIVSTDGCTVAVCPDGQVFTSQQGKLEEAAYNACRQPLAEVLRLAAPKSQRKE